MRAFRLTAASLEAERVLLTLQAQRTARRVVFGVVAAIMAGCALAMLHLLVWVWLGTWTPLQRVSLLLGADVLLAAIFGTLALRSTPGPQEVEARVLRDTAFAQARSSLSLLPLIGTVATSPLIAAAVGLLRRRR
ncbi:hypothetical protein [Teichococcus vastitatis]|jgi:hypothetical protein|uniref:Phage holin family protein n=1 Tax=Teichococcus vastitatis TaxID=2307076 RepID=A0ABS9WC71_9PROT|nr:hypothetical protein [Pseudoroseomonas vastitatis]MCI0756884.1 hypothetical protein [Pseudoroseomonas vastitatis]